MKGLLGFHAFSVGVAVAAPMLMPMRYAVAVWIAVVAASTAISVVRARILAIRRTDEAAVGHVRVQANAWVVADVERFQNGHRYYRAYLGKHHIGDIEYEPESHRSMRWLAHYPSTGVASASAFASKQGACQSLVHHHAAHAPFAAVATP